MHLYTCIYTYMYTHDVYIYIYINTHTYAHIYIYIYLYLFIYLFNFLIYTIYIHGLLNLLTSGKLWGLGCFEVLGVPGLTGIAPLRSFVFRALGYVRAPMNVKGVPIKAPTGVSVV